ncbi:hypothetical protein OJ997_03150 [Solirubrobacter phytolaccae]|uniref:Uncharacterized protein n=1 Tax=Solirubrobacter phytolaccae TaxID=1404360 RepID=A0A9X3SD10_9ACTN|nr:hypothetical protein [Solirubrobacter phytolaccae]MDA0179282.1 hypothetical protein [Solirubrobacter phytolaccae]
MFRLIAAFATFALVVPAAAEAKVLRGKTSQGRSVTVVLQNGVPKRLKIGWSLSCKKNKSTGPTSTRFFRPYDQATADVINDADSSSASLGKGWRVRNSAKLTGTRADATWSGTFSVKRSFYRKGKKFDECRADNVTWSVS